MRQAVEMLAAGVISGKDITSEAAVYQTDVPAGRFAAPGKKW
jgi:hypothetical protein